MWLSEKKESIRKRYALYRIRELNKTINLLLNVMKQQLLLKSIIKKTSDSEIRSQQKIINLRFIKRSVLNCTNLRNILLNRTYTKEKENVLKKNFTKREILQAMNIMNYYAHKWLRFDVYIYQHCVHIFINSEVSNYYIFKRVVDQLKLEIE